MVKVVVISDSHWGIKNSDPKVFDYMKKFLEEVFFPTIQERNIKTIIHLGDLVDKQRFITGTALKHLRDEFLIPISNTEAELYVCVGNHDSVYKNTLSHNFVTETCLEFPNITVVDKPTEVSNVLLVPWINASNFNEVMDAMNTTRCDIVGGHFAIEGFRMYKNTESKSGLSSRIFDRHALVLSGHYHTRSTQGNITYVGAPLDFTWQDYDDPKGFHILDTETCELEFILNPYMMHSVIEYNDNIDIDETIANSYNKILKVMIKEDISNIQRYDTFINRLSDVAISFSIVDLKTTSLPTESITTEELETMDTLKFFKTTFNELENATQLNELIAEIYEEALTTQ